MKIKKYSLIANILTLASGTMFSQGILLLASPVLTRIYSPEHFGMVAAFMALVASILPCATGKYEIALVLPKRESSAIELFSIAILFASTVFTLFLVFVLSFQDLFLNWLNAPKLKYWILLAPLLLFIFSMFNLCNSFSNRNKQYSTMARSRIIRSSVIVLVSFSFGYIYDSFIGLLLGQFLGLSIATTYLASSQWGKLKKVSFKWGRKKAALAKRYIRYPTFSASTGLLNGITVALPVLFITHNFSIITLGYYALVLQVIYAPLNMVSSAISTVHLKNVVEINQKHARADIYLYKIAIALALISAIPTLIFVLYGPQIFVIIFGEKWEEAGRFSQILALGIMLRFVTSTLSTSIGATHNNHLGAIWKIIALISTLLVLILITKNGSINDLLIAIVINDSLLYILYFLLIVKAIKNPRN